jgi:pectate lyase
MSVQRRRFPAVIGPMACALLLAAGCGSSEESTPAQTGGSGVKGTGGATASSSSGGTTAVPGSGGDTASAGTGGTSAATGTGGATATGSGGMPSTGGRAGAAGGALGSGGRGGGAAASGGAGPGVMLSASCKIPTWPAATGTPITITGTRTVTGVYDGKMALHQGTLDDCTNGAQGSTTPIFEIADGGTVRNIVFGAKVGDGIHCLGTCTIENVWFPFICDDAITMLGGAGKTATITGSGFMGARDKTIQHNGDGSTVVIDNVYVETAGKLYRSCGSGGGCGPASSKRTVKASNIVAIGVGQVIGVSTNDTATLTNICAYRTPVLCHTYQPGSDNDAAVGANATGEGANPSCNYKSTDSHALVNKVSGSLATDALCPGPNSVKTGSTATACVPGFESCLKACAPGSYGYKGVSCAAGLYTDGASACALPADPATAAHFASSNTTTATTTVTSNAVCATEWAWAKDSTAKFCMCVRKPGFYQASTTTWTVWDCQSSWF